MGLKSTDTSATSSDQIQQMQKQAFEELNKEYEMARITTHLNRGKGLGFGSAYSSATQFIDPNNQNH
jgi:hypothetical protein